MSMTLTGGRAQTVLRSVTALVVSAVAAAGLTAAGLIVGVAPASAATGSLGDPSISINHVGTVATAIDPNLSDSIIASNDRLGMTWAFSTQGVTAGTLAQTLPAGWTWDTTTLGSLSSTSSAYHSEYTLSPDGRTLAATVSVPGQAYLELGTLVAVPGGDVVAGSGYVPELIVTDQSGAATVTAAPVTVVSEPRADLSSATLANAVAGNFDVNGDSTAEAAYYVDVRLTVQDAVGAASIGAAAVNLAQPLTIADSFVLSDPGVDVVAELVDQSESGASVSLVQNGTDLTVTIDGAAALPTFWTTVRFWVAAVDVPSALDSPSTLDISNSATAVGWTSTAGDVVSEEQSNNVSSGYVQIPAPPAGSVESGASIFVADDPAAPLYGIDPVSVPQWSIVDGASVAPDSIVQDRFFLAPHPAGITGLIGYDFWNPDTRRIVDGADLFLADASGVPLNAATYSVQYTSGSDVGDPADNTWYGSIAAAGGVGAVSGVRFVYTAGVFASDTVVAAVPFTVVADAGDEVGGTSAWTYTENSDVVTATASATVHVQLLSVAKSADVSSIVSGSSLTYTVTPTVSAPAGSLQPAAAPGLEIVDTLPPGVVSVDLDGLDPLWGASQSGNVADGFVLTFTYLGAADSATTLPPIVYSVVTSIEAPGAGYTSTAVISAAGNVQSLATRSASAAVSVIQAQIVAMQNVVDGPAAIEVGETQVSWLGSWRNFTSTSKGAGYFVSVLPAPGDGRGTGFHGSARLASAQLQGTGVDLQYTTDPASAVNAASPQDGASVAWIPAGSTDLSTVSGITALRVVVADLGSGSSGAGSLRITLDVNGQQAGDRYIGSLRGWAQSTQGLGETEPARVDVVASSVSGSVWNDEDRSATRDNDERGIAGATVDLVDTSGDVVANTTTVFGGGFSFTGLASGAYRVRIDDTTVGRAQIIVNTFDLDGDEDGDSGAITVPPDSAIVGVDFGYALETSSLSLVSTVNGEKTAEAPGPVVAVGHEVSWGYTVTNTGTTTVTGVDVVDDGAGEVEAPRRFDGELSPGESVVFTAEATSVDGQHSSRATASGEAPSRTVTARFRSWYQGAVPSLSVSKRISTTAGGPWTQQVDLTPGAEAYWKLTVTNTGRTVVSDVVIEDSLLKVSRPVGDLDPGKSVSIVISQTMIDAFLSTDFAGNSTTGVGGGAGSVPGTGPTSAGSSPVVTAEFATAVGAAAQKAGGSHAAAGLAATGGAQRGALLLGGMLVVMAIIALVVSRRRRHGHGLLRR